MGAWIPVSGAKRGAVPDAAREIAAREARILAVARALDCTAEKRIAVFDQLDAIH